MKAIGNYIILKEIVENIVKIDGGLELAEKHREDIRYRKGTIISSGPDMLKKNDQINITLKKIKLRYMLC